MADPSPVYLVAKNSKERPSAKNYKDGQMLYFDDALYFAAPHPQIGRRVWIKMKKKNLDAVRKEYAHEMRKIVQENQDQLMKWDKETLPDHINTWILTYLGGHLPVGYVAPSKGEKLLLTADPTTTSVRKWVPYSTKEADKLRDMLLEAIHKTEGEEAELPPDVHVTVEADY